MKWESNKLRSSLPIDEKISEILNVLKESSNLVLSASPGAGKTTRLPPALLELTKLKVLVLEPRRMAAVAAATRIAEEEAWNLGSQVGYQVRFENRTSKDTRLIFLTEALLSRKILQDASLKDVGIVVLDEFHERSIHIDLALGLLKEIQTLARPDLKIIVMSATLDVKKVSEFLDDSPVINMPGRSFDLQLMKSKQSQLLRTDLHFISRIEDAIKAEVSRRSNGKDILVFLPGASEISRCERALTNWAQEKNILLLSLSGSLSLQDQLLALKPSIKRKIILSTNVAESSVTIDGVDTVIDSGLVRILKKHPKTDFEQLVIARISKASAKQRAGRAARQWAGQCIQLWTGQDELSMPEFEVAEILRTDLTETVLFLKKWGISSLDQFSWFETPPLEQLKKCEAWLEKIGALRSGKITDEGMALVDLPLHPRIGRILKVAESLGAGILGCDIAAILQERDIKTAGHHHAESDLIERIELLNDRTRNPLIETIVKSSSQLQKCLGRTNSEYELSFDLIAEIMLKAYPDRLCRRRSPEQRRAVMIGGRGVELADTSAVKKSEFFIALSVMEADSSKETQVRLATGVSKKLIEKHFLNEFKKESRMTFDVASKNFYVEEFNSLWDLALEEPRRRIAKPVELEARLPEALAQNFELICQQNEALKNWLERWQFFEQKKKYAATFWNSENILKAIEMACVGENRWAEVIEKDLVYFFESIIDAEVRKDFHKLCPDQIEVPTKNKIRIHYHTDKSPHIEVRLQELFGMSQTPRIWDQSISIVLHLLGPNYRPVQVTADLASFWANTYQEVKRELKIRYPKHSWPDDPLTALAVAKGRPRR